MTQDEIEALAHREAWRYKKSSDPHHSDTYTFNRSTLLEFARKLIEEEREACAKIADEHDTWEINPAYNIAERIRMRSDTK